MGAIYFNITISFLIFLIAFFFKRQRWEIEYVYIFLSFVLLVFLHSSVDINSVPDLPSYSSSFTQATWLPFYKAICSFRTTEYVFHGFLKIVSYFSNNFQFFLLVYNLVLFALYYRTFIRFSKEIGYIMLPICMLLLTTYSQSLFVLRQHLAVAIILNTYQYIINRKFTKFLIIFTIAFFVHHSAIIWFPIYFLYGIKNKKIYVVIMLILLLLIPILSDNLLLINDLLSLQYDVYASADKESFSFVNVLVCLVYLISYIVFLRFHVFDNGINKLVLILLSLSTVGMMLGESITIANRANLYFTVSYMFSVPITVQYIKKDIIKLIYVVGVIVVNAFLTYELWLTEFFASFKFSIIPIHYVVFILLASIAIARNYKILVIRKI